jgi:hypothetical protein
MPTHECKPLLDICGPDIYSRNAFRLLAADVDMKGRQIKRHEKELQAALKIDELADEYSHAFRPDPLPTREELSQAGRTLTDAQQRFIHEFFWFWPLEWGKSGSDKVLKLIKAGQVKAVQKQWEQIAVNGNEASLVAKHNLAVLGHFLVLAREQKILGSTGNGQLANEQRQRLNAYWRFAFKHWTPLCNNESFWSLQAERIRHQNDSRLTTGFLRRFSQSLPVAFCNINADMAVAYCNREMYNRAQDHILFRKLSNVEDDAIETSLRRVTAPLNGRIDHAIETATSQLIHHKAEGKPLSIELFKTVEGILIALKTLLGEETQEYIETCDRVAESLLQCQVAYGNETEDWNGSIPLLENALTVARGNKVRTRIEENLKIVHNNRQLYICWFCDNRPKEDQYSITVTLKKPILWRDIKRNPEQYREAILQIISQVASSLNMHSAYAFQSALKSQDLQALLRFLDNNTNLYDSQELMTQQMTTTVPRCCTCSAVHSRGTPETVGAIEKNLRAAQATIEREARTLESLTQEITAHLQAMEAAWFARKWGLSSALKSLRRKEDECKRRHQEAQKKRVRLQSQLKQRQAEGEVKAYEHFETWPAVVEAKHDGFHISYRKSTT